mgnify:FL=1
MGFDYFTWMKRHVGHHITCVCYGDSTHDPDDVCIECETCNEVLFSAETLCLQDEENDFVDSLQKNMRDLDEIEWED